MDMIVYQPVLNIDCDDVEKSPKDVIELFKDTEDTLMGIIKTTFDLRTGKLKSVELLDETSYTS